MKLCLFLTIVSSCIPVAVMQDEACEADMFENECKLITANIAMACYVRDLAPGMTSVFGICCETCRKFIDPLALPGCEYGDKSFGCSARNCSVPNRQDTKLCCKTCRASIKAEMNLLVNMTTASTTGTTTSTTETTSNQPAVQTTKTKAPSTAETTTMPTTTTQSTTMTTELSTEAIVDSVSSSTSTTTTSTAPSTTTSTINAPTTAQSTTTTTSSTIGPVTIPTTTTTSLSNNTGDAQTPTSNINPSSSTNLCLNPNVVRVLKFCQKILNVCSINGFRVICCIDCGGVNRAADDCQDRKNCEDLRPAQCYSKSVRDVCCAKCKAIKESITNDCPYGDRLPTWCRFMFARSPQYLCMEHRGNCCYTCRNPVVNTRKIVVLPWKQVKSWRKKWTESRKKRIERRHHKKSRKGSRRGGKRKSNWRRERRD